MGKYIDADRLKELLNNKYKKFTEKSKNYCFMQYQFMADGLNIAEQMVDSLQQEQQEVDLENEIEDFLHKTGAPYFWTNDSDQLEWCCTIARHFYELGRATK